MDASALVALAVNEVAVTVLQSVEVDAPLFAVWQKFCDVPAWPQWFPALTAVKRDSTTPFVIGEAFTLSLAFRGHTSDVKVKVVAVSATTVRWIGNSFGVTGDHAFRAESIDPTRTRFTSEEHFSGFPVRLLPRSIFRELELEAKAGLERFRALLARSGG